MGSESFRERLVVQFPGKPVTHANDTQNDFSVVLMLKT